MNVLQNSLRIGVLRGGPSPEYDTSLQSGANVLRHLSETHRPIDIFISRDGKWHMQGVERSPERILRNVDVIFNALHGAYGEDGGVQEVLNLHGVPYTGSDRYSSAIAMNKWITKERAKAAGIKTPISVLVRGTDPLSEKAQEIFNSIPHPLIVKPACSSGSFGLYKVNTFKELVSVLQTILKDHDSAIVEEFISGKDVSCLITDNFRGQDVYSFPVNQDLGRKEKEAVENISKKIHIDLGLSHYSQSDFIVSPRRGVYFLEVNTLPKFNEKSVIPKTLEAVGVSMKEFLHHLIGLAIG